MASQVDICNGALQKLGALRIQNITDNTVNARACNNAFDNVRRAELRTHPWNFAIKRASLAANATPPLFGYTGAYPLPTDFLRLMPPDPFRNFEDMDWIIEGKEILTNDGAPLEIRYIADITDTNTFDAAFVMALEWRLALELCEEITQSNQKKAQLESDYEKSVQEARKISAIEKPPVLPPDDKWITVRR